MRKLCLLIALVALMVCMMPVGAQRRVTPVDNASTATQPINEFEGDTARANAIKRASLMHYHDQNGRVVYIDTVTGQEWVDSTAIKAQKKQRIKYPLLESAEAGVDVMQPFLRLFGQHYGLMEVWGALSIHNRFKPVVELGLGSASNTPAGANFTYRSPVAPYFRLGMDYNFMYGSKTDYSVYVGVRYGFTSFRYDICDVVYDNGYWGDTQSFDLPRMNATVGWGEIVAGLRVRLWRSLYAGWAVRYHHILHKRYGEYGEPWYVPGVGTRTSKIAVSFSFSYKFKLGNKHSAPSPQQ